MSAHTYSLNDSIQIPIARSSMVLEVKVSELGDPQELLRILRAETAPLKVWIEFAYVYLTVKNNPKAFEEVLSIANDSRSMDNFYRDQKRERIIMLNTLAAYYGDLAVRSTDPQQREFNFSRATHWRNRSDRIGGTDSLTWIGRGLLRFQKGEYEKAWTDFDSALNQDPTNFTALLGKGWIAFYKGRYNEACRLYIEALKANPRCPGYVRLGIAYCYYKLDKMEMARFAFERTLGVDPESTEALVALAIIHLNSDVDPASNRERALNFLRKAYDISLKNPNVNNPNLLNHLSNHFFISRDYEKAHQMASKATMMTNVKSILAESYYHIGRTHHVQNEFEKANEFYKKAVEANPDFTLAQWGKGLLFLRTGDLKNSLGCFEKVFDKYPNQSQVLRILGSLYSRLGQREKAYKFLRQTAELEPTNAEVLLELASLIERENPTESLQHYSQAKSILKAQNKPISPEIFNNLGVLHHKAQNFEKAEKFYLESIKMTGMELADMGLENITTTFNIARLKEDSLHLKEATELYHQLLKAHPTYTDTLLRLGAIEESQGNREEALKYFEKALEVNPKSLEALSMMGYLHLEQEQYKKAQDKFEQIISINKHDPYSLLAMGNIYFSAKVEASNKEKDQKYLKLAFDFYWKVLQLDPCNVYAANGLGAIFASKEQFFEAKDFFGQVKEAHKDMPDVFVNLAQVYLQQGLFLNAIKMYEFVSKKFYNNSDPVVLTYLAKAYYEGERYLDSKTTLQKAIRLNPSNMALFFNLALSQENYAVSTLKSQQKKTLKEVQRAFEELGGAVKTFNWLAEKKEDPRSQFIAQKAEKHARYCSTTLELAQTHISKAEESERKQQQLLENQRKIREQEEDEHRQMREKQEQEELERKQRQMEIAAEAERLEREKILAWQTQILEEQEKKRQKESTKKKKKQKDDDFIAPEDEPALLEEDDQEESIDEMRNRKHRQAMEKRRGKDVPDETAVKRSKKEKKDKKKKKKKKDKKKEKDQSEGEPEDQLDLDFGENDDANNNDNNTNNNNNNNNSASQEETGEKNTNEMELEE